MAALTHRPQKPLVLLGLGAFSIVGGGRRNENRLAMAYKALFVVPAQQIEETRLNYWFIK
jgi:hypothetical protein